MTLKDILEVDVHESYFINNDRFKAKGYIMDSEECIYVKENNGRYTKAFHGDCIKISQTGSNGTRVKSQSTFTLTTRKHEMGVVIKTSTGLFRIRYFTELEHSRLMGLSDESFYKRKEAGIDSPQMYKQNGNSIVIPALESVIKLLGGRDMRISIGEFFSGYGSQLQALKNIGSEITNSYIIEIDIDATIAYAAIHCDLNEKMKVTNFPSKEELIEQLSKLTLWKNEKPVSLKRQTEYKLRQIWLSMQLSNNYNDVFTVKAEDLPYADLITWSSPCFLKGTSVKTNKGYKNIEDLCIGDMVLTHENSYKKVVNWGFNENKEIYKIKTQGILDIFCTNNHPFYAKIRNDKWNNDIRRYNKSYSEPQKVRLESLKKGDLLGININQKSIIPTFNNSLKEYENNTDFYWLLGRYLGDGWQRDEKYQKRTIICCGKHEKDILLDKINKLKKDDFTFHFNGQKTTYRLCLNNRDLFNIVKEFGKGAKNKVIPNWIEDLPVYLLRSFIDGYLSADGCNIKGLNKITTISKSIALGITNCIHKVYKTGVRVYFFKRKPTHIIEDRVVNQNDTYQIVWHDNASKKLFYVEDGIIWYPIKSIENTNTIDTVYNITVEDTHTYTSNNAICYNCQDFSQAGKQKGFDGLKGGLTFRTIEVFKELKKLGKAPKFMLFENVPAITSKKFKDGFDLMCSELESLGYKNHVMQLNAKDFGIPQSRKRVFILSVRNDIASNFNFEIPKGVPLTLTLKDLLEDNPSGKYLISKEKTDTLKRHGNKIVKEDTPEISSCIHSGYYKNGGRDQQYLRVDDKYYLSDAMKRFIVSDHPSYHCATAPVNRDIACVVNTKDGGRRPTASNYIVEDVPMRTCLKKYLEETGTPVESLKVRKLTELECNRLMCMPDESHYKRVEAGISSTQLYKQSGNSIVVNVLEAILKELFHMEVANV